MKFGLISDTHGELAPRILDLFDGVDFIIHCGDVGNEDILIELGAVAPLTAVRGNTDKGILLDRLPEIAAMDTPAGVLVATHYQPRGLPPFNFPNVPVTPSIIIFGHTHFPKVLKDETVTLINPGSALYGRGAPPTVARLHIEDDSTIETAYFNVLTGEPFPASVSYRHGDKAKPGVWP